jgi:aminoglycoside 6'-N-acetyltransferase
VPAVRLVPFDPARHLVTVAAWLTQPHVSRWWGTPQEALAEVGRHSATTAAMVEVDAQLVGYLCWQTPSRAELAAAGLDDLPPDLVDIDIAIGEPGMLGRGVGPAALCQLLRRLQADGTRTAGLATAVANEPALRAFHKAGFRPFRDFREGGQLFRYLIRELAAA